MTAYRRWAALSRAAGSVARQFSCEPLGRRVLLDGDPVIVLTEAFSLDTWPTVTSETVDPWLWKNDQEFLWDLDDWDADPPPWNDVDGDDNTYADDAYGWNFEGGGSPNIIGPHAGGALGGGAAHGATIVDKVLRVLGDPESPWDRVRIMHVLGSGSQIVDYVIDQKDDGVNIVAVSNSTQFGSKFTRDDAEDLRDNGILLFVGSDNAGNNADEYTIQTSSTSSFFHATGRFWNQEPPVHTILPVTTDPAVLESDFGINSFYFAAADPDLNVDAQSWAQPIAATYAALAVEAYQDAHTGASPTPEQIKRAMMSGVSYIEGLDGKTITHDYDDDPLNPGRRDGGALSLDKIIEAINDTDQGITGVSMTAIPQGGTTVLFTLNKTGPTPTNWTISWGDNSGDDQSGVEVRAGAQSSVSHPFPRDIQPHTYYPTLYAMLGTGSQRSVYLPAGAAQPVLIDSELHLTPGKDEYTLSRSGDNLFVELDNPDGHFEMTIGPEQLPTCILELGAGGDTLTIDFTNGDPLYFTDLTVTGSGTNLIRIVGRPTADSIDAALHTIEVNGNVIQKDQTIAVYIDGAGGDDYLRSASIAQTTLVGGAGDDLIDLVASPAVVMPGGGNDTLHVNSTRDDNARALITASETFSNINIFTGGGVVMDADGSLVLRSGALNIESNGFLDLADNAMILDELEPPALETVQGFLKTAYNDGAWDGEGIRSSLGDDSEFGIGYAPATDFFTTFPATFEGQQVDNNAMLLKHTLYGDTDLDGDVDLDDFNRFAPNFNQTEKRWSQGDFDYDGDVDLDDFDLLSGNWDQGSGFASGTYGAQSQSSSSSSSPGTGGYTVEDLLNHLLNGGTGLP